MDGRDFGSADRRRRLDRAGVHADPLACSLSAYNATAGLAAAVEGSTLTLTWDGDKNGEVRLRLSINSGTPTIQEVAVRSKGSSWATVATNLTPEFRVVSGYRRLDQEALPALKVAFNDEITQRLLDRYKWDAFWDAPLRVPGDEIAHGNSTPPPNGIPRTDQPGLPRKAAEIRRATASFKAQSCEVDRRPSRSVVSGRPDGHLCRAAAIHRLQGHEPDSPGGDCEDR
jgi:hypothetical protein